MTRARLTVVAGEATPPVCDIAADGPVSLGRHRTNAVVLHDEHASRHHAEITFDGAAWRVDNVGTPLNGTRVNGLRIARPTALEDGSEIGIGDTRLRFSLVAADEAPTAEKPKDGPAEVPDDISTLLLADELTALCNFMTASVEATDATTLIRRALETVRRHTGAVLVGFLSLDPEGPVPKLIVPEEGQVDTHLSRHLTQRVQQSGETVWLASTPAADTSDSLGPFADALCLPVKAGGTALGALHAYRSAALFTERHKKFCEVLAGYLANSLHVLRARRILEAENSRLRGHTPAADQLIGASPVMQSLRQRIGRAAPRPATVLIRGESGVGKELVALALHRQSPWRDGPLVVVNCAAIAATLPEAELFGHRKGAFTGADRDRPGLFQQADEGTLFLDEVGELPLDCQAKLLRVIEGKGFRPVGATAEVHVDVRVIAATNRDLERDVKRGAFRQDLYFRLQVILVPVPPLREHLEDIPDLVRHYLDKLAFDCRRQVMLTDAALQRLAEYSWPGNVRQLWAVLESAATMTDSPILDAADLPLPPETLGPLAPTLNLDDLETWAIRQALKRTKGNVSQAARILGVVRDTLTNKMKKKGISREE